MVRQVVLADAEDDCKTGSRGQTEATRKKSQLQGVFMSKLNNCDISVRRVWRRTLFHAEAAQRSSGICAK